MTESQSVRRVCSHQSAGMARYCSSEESQTAGGFTIVRVAENVRSTHNQDGGIVLDILHGQMFRLNLVGSRILELLKQGCSETQIADEISRQCAVPREIVEADLRGFLSHLEKHHLLQYGRQDTRTER
jgi:hypothetical protein